MAEWQKGKNVRMAECQNGRKGGWQKGRKGGWQNGKMAECRNVRMAEFRNVRMAECRNVRMAECPIKSRWGLPPSPQYFSDFMPATVAMLTLSSVTEFYGFSLNFLFRLFLSVSKIRLK